MAYTELALGPDDVVTLTLEDLARVKVTAIFDDTHKKAKVGITAPARVEVVRNEIAHRYPSRKAAER